jgi:1,4-alpha-glucan branching enzyme
MTTATRKNAHGYMSFTLHAHLPYVVNHGTWPHGLEWLHEAAAETYLPLLRTLHNLERDGLAMHATINLSPILLEQLAHPVFKTEFPKYVERKILAAREDEAFFSQNGDHHFAETARFWQRYYEQALADFRALDSDIIRDFRYFNDKGLIEIITCCATHGYNPLLGTDESIRAQVHVGVATHEKHIGREPRGIWAPECGYRPAGFWNYPVPAAGTNEIYPAFERIGVEQAFAENRIDYFFVDTHLIEESMLYTPYNIPHNIETGEGDAKFDLPKGSPKDIIFEDAKPQRSFYQPYYVEGPYARVRPCAIFPRDPRTGLQVWSGDAGYPGDGNYLDFHKKRWPGGHRYWEVTSSKADLGSKQPYHPDIAAQRIRDHAEHFVSIVCDALRTALNDEAPPILSSPFDAELFGHWWFEGVQWLEHVARVFAREDCPVKLINCTDYIDRHPPQGFLTLPEGSWGKNGNNEVWMNPDTSWTWTHIYPAEVAVRDLATSDKWRDGALGERIMKQLCRELLLLESSDWQFLITTQAARDYAEERFATHQDLFREVLEMWRQFEMTGTLKPDFDERLAAIELRDSVFADIDPSLWARKDAK